MVVGTGISLAQQATLEGIEAMRRAERLLYVVTNRAAEIWIRRLNPAAESMNDLYAPGKRRRDTYDEMVDRVLARVRAGFAVCAVFYGHPGAFVYPSHVVIDRARHEGFQARMLPGISAEDCLIADLGVNPSDHGFQSFEATDFLGSRRRFDPTSALILWQVGLLGEPSVRPRITCRPERLRALTNALRRTYPASHHVIIYEAAEYPLCDPIVRRVPLRLLPRQRILPTMTLYIPPRPGRRWDPMVRRWLRADEPVKTGTTAPRSGAVRAASASRSPRRGA